MIAKLFVSATIVLGAAVGSAAPAGAEPDFDDLTCSCRAPGAVTSPHVDDQLHQGIQDAIDLPAAPGLPPL